VAIGRLSSLLAALVLAATVTGCASSLPGEEPLPPGPPPTSELPEGQNIVSGAPDSTAPAPGAAGALYRYRFLQVLPGSSGFTYQDRDLSFYFRPAPDALYFQVENRKDRPVSIEWDRCVFRSPRDESGPVAHGPTRWEDRFNVQPATQIAGLQRYSDYLFPLDYLVDAGGGSRQLHRPLLPEDSTAPEYSDKEFGVDLVFRIENQPRTYSFRFKVASVIPN
jgi:hypothetical protein